MNNGKANIIDTNTLVKASLMTAISIVLTRFFFFFIPIAGSPALRISFGEIPIMMVGLIFGPTAGAVSGLAADGIGVLLSPQGVFHPGFTLSSILWGVIPGLFSFFFKRRKEYMERYSKRNIFITVFVCFLVISIYLNTIWLSTLYGQGVLILLPGRILGAIINIPLQSFVMYTLFKSLRRTIQS